MTTWQDALARLQHIGALRYDHDGEGSTAPDAKTLALAYAIADAIIAKSLAPPHRVVPGVKGTICFEWHLPEVFLEVEVYPDRAECRKVIRSLLPSREASL